ncbi:hypothetical protein IH779_01600 [Patescibacteria group bacterium]|nr:hypothetical protein [Patescibacteria group bacterium]
MKSFTLIELIIYIAIIGVVLIFMSGFLWNIIFGNIKETAYQEVQQNARFALTKITQETKKAAGINNPSPGNSAPSLSLAMAASHLDPTVFDVVDGKLRITQGASGPYALTSDQVIVSNLQFTNLSYPDTPGTVRAEMTIEHINPSARTEYAASINLISSISLVPGGAVGIPPHITQLHYRWRNDDGRE